MGEVGLCFCLWRSRRKREDDKPSEKRSGISVYYGDYGIEEDIYGENGFFSTKKQEMMAKEAMEEHENVIVMLAKKTKTKKKTLYFGFKRRDE